MTREEALEQVAKNLYFKLCMSIRPSPAIFNEPIADKAINNMVSQVIEEGIESQLNSRKNHNAIQEEIALTQDKCADEQEASLAYQNRLKELTLNGIK